MIHQSLTRSLSQACAVLALLLCSCVAANATPVFWTTGWDPTPDPGPGFRGQGTITTPTATVNVTYTNAQGIGFYQPSGGTDFWTPRNPVSNSPYTSSLVDNPPTGTDIVALQFAEVRRCRFSQTVANPVFAYVQSQRERLCLPQPEFDILSFGAGLTAAPPGDNSLWLLGCGTSFKNIVNLPNGNIDTSCSAPVNRTGPSGSPGRLTPSPGAV